MDSEVQQQRFTASDLHILELLWLRLATAAMAGEGHFVIMDHESASTYSKTLDRTLTWLRTRTPPAPPEDFSK